MKKSQLKSIIRGLIKEQEISNCQDVITVKSSDVNEQLGGGPVHLWEKCYAFDASGNQVFPGSIGNQQAFGFGNISSTGQIGQPFYSLYVNDPNNFFDWAQSQVGPISPGDSFIFDMLGGGICTSPWGSNVRKMCMKYVGTTSSSWNGFMWTGTNAAGHTKDCCSTPPPPPPPPNLDNCHDQATFDICSSPPGWLNQHNAGSTTTTWNYSPTNIMQGLQCNGVMCGPSDIGQSFDMSPFGPLFAGVIANLIAVNVPTYRPTPGTMSNAPCSPPPPPPSDPCDDFLAATQLQQDSCCGKCINGVYMGMAGDQCDVLTNSCKCCPEDRRPEERGCLDPTATNYNQCCPQSNYPGCIPTIQQDDCCEYERRTGGDDPCSNPDTVHEECFICQEPPSPCITLAQAGITPAIAVANNMTMFSSQAICNSSTDCLPQDPDPVEEIRCQCCNSSPSNLTGVPESMIGTYPNPPGCSALNGGQYYNCNVAGSPINCKKPGEYGTGEVPLDPPLGEGLISRFQKLANIKK